MALSFTPLSGRETTDIVSLLTDAYLPYREAHPLVYETWRLHWLEYQQMVDAYPESVGECGFYTCFNKEIIGFASWDPRRFPCAEIGHTCIRRQWQGRGYGILQLHEVLRRLQQQHFQRVTAATMEELFFLPAERMFLSCGFAEKRRFVGGEKRKARFIEYEMSLQNYGSQPLEGNT